MKNKLVQKMFNNRGFDTELTESKKLLQYLECSAKDELADIHEMVSLMNEWKDRVFTIIPDFDTDGIMCGIIGYAGMSELGFNVNLFIPEPQKGYGFNSDTIVELVKEYPETNVIITCDTGISCIDGVAFAKVAGIDVLVTDHHVQKKQNGYASCIVNPKKLGETYSMPDICGAFVLYKVLQCYADTYCNEYQQKQIEHLRVFAGISTISDSMPIIYENRELVKYTLMICQNIYWFGDNFIQYITGCDLYCRVFKGLMVALLSFDITEIDINFFSYYFIPTFNSIKRLGNREDLKKGFGVFFERTPRKFMQHLKQMNEERKDNVNKYMEEIESIPQPFAPCIYFSTAPPGILGLLASKLNEKNKVPALVVRKDKQYHGSGRSPDWFPFMSITEKLPIFTAGHENAFGVGFSNEQEIVETYQFLLEQIPVEQEKKNIKDWKPDFVISTDGTGDVGIDILTLFDFIQAVKEYEPFGVGFPEPKILLKFKTEEGSWSIIGNNHLKVYLKDGFEVLLWNQGNKLDYKEQYDSVTVVGNISVNDFGGNMVLNFVGVLEHE